MTPNNIPYINGKDIDYIIDKRVRGYDIGYANDYSVHGTKTIYQICKDFFTSITTGQRNATIYFGLTDTTSIPSDIPNNTKWKYSWGYCRFRHTQHSSGTCIASIVLYGYGADSGIAVKKVINDSEGDWTYIGAAVETFTITADSSITDVNVRFNENYYDPNTDLVHINYEIYSASGIIPGAGVLVAVIPESYRPDRVVTRHALCRVDTLTNIKSEDFYINSSGQIKMANFVLGKNMFLLTINTVYKRKS